MSDAQKKDQEEITSLEKGNVENGTGAPNDHLSELAMDHFFALSLELMSIMDMAGAFRLVNPAFESSLGWILDDLEETPFITLVHPDDVKTTLSAFKSISETEDSIKFNNRVLCQDGSYKSLSWHAQQTSDDLIYAIAHAAPASNELHQQASMLKYRARQMEISIEISEEISSTTSLDELFSRVAELLRTRFEYYGVNVYAIEGQRLVLQAGTSDVAQNIEQVGYSMSLESDGILPTYVARTGQPHLISDLVQDTDWLPHPFLPESKAVIAVPIKLRDQVLGVIDIHSDTVSGITEEDRILLLGLCSQIAIAIDQHYVDAERRQVEMALRESEERFQQVVSSMSGFVYMADILADGTRANRYIAPSVMDLTGYDLENFTHDTQFWTAKVVHPDDLPIIDEQLALLDQGQNSALNYRLIKANGQTIWVNDNVRINEDTVQQRQTIYGIVTEVTEHKETAGALSEALGEAQILYKISQVLSSIDVIENSLVDILQVLNENNVAREANMVNLIGVIPDEAGEPAWLEMMAWHMPDGREPLYPVGNRYDAVDNNYAELWIGNQDTPIFVENIHTDSRLSESLREQYLKMKMAATVIMPLSLAGEWLGLLNFGWAKPQTFTALDLRVYRSLMQQFSVAVDNHHLTNRMQTALSEANVFRQLAESSGQGVGIATLDGDVTYVNPTLARIMGESHPENVYGKKFYAYYLPEVQRRFEREILPTVFEEGQWVGELAIRSISGGMTSTLENIFLVRDQDGTPSYIADVVTDISDFKQSENILAKRALELKTVAEVSTAISSILDVDQLLERIVNLTKESFDLYHVHVYLMNERGDTLVLRSGAGDVGHQMVTEGRQIPLNRTQSLVARSARERKSILVNDVKVEPGFLSHPLLPDTRAELAAPMVVGNKLIGVIDVQADTVGRFTEEDLTIQATLAAQIAIALDNARLLQRTEASLREIQRLATIVENQTDFMGVCDLDGKLQYVNPGGRAMLGISNQADISRLAIFDFMPPSDIEQLTDIGIPTAAKEGSWLQEINLHLRNGTTIPVEQSVTVNQDAYGRPYTYNIIMHDISERKIAEEEQKRLVAEVEGTIRQFIEQEWTRFLDERPDGNWAVEYNQRISSDQITPPPILNELQDQVLHNGGVKVSTEDLDLDEQSNSVMVAPIPLRGQIIGTVALEDVDPDRHWSRDDMALVQAVSEQLALTIENLRLFNDAQQLAHRERIVADMTQQIWSSGELEQVMQTAVAELGEKLDAAEVVIKLGPEFLEDLDEK